MSKLSLASLLVLLPLALCQAQIEKVVIEAEGLDDTSLAAKLEQAVKKVAGVAKVSVVSEEDTVEVEIVPDAKVALAEIERAVRDAGVFIQAWKLTATGVLVEQRGRPLLRIARNQVEILADSSDGDVRQRIRELAAKGPRKPIKVTGILDKVADGAAGQNVIKLWIEELDSDP